MVGNNGKMAYHVLGDKDFYPPSDEREYESSVDDIENGDNYFEYARSFYEEYGDWLFDDWRL